MPSFEYKEISPNSRELLAACLSLQLWPRNWSAFVRLTKICGEAAFSILRPNTVTGLTLLSQKVQRSDRVTSLCAAMIKNAPDYPMAEDYLSEVEWGAVSVQYEGSLFRIFYGGPYDTPYEYWQEYLLYFSSRSQTRNEVVDVVLRLQDEILRSILLPPISNDDIEPGHLEMPPTEFVEQVIQYLERFETGKLSKSSIHSGQCLQRDFVEKTSLPQAPDEIQDLFQPFVFIDDGSTVLPLFPVSSLGSLPCHLAESMQTELQKEGSRKAFRQSIARYIANCGFRKNVLLNVETRVGGSNICFDIGIVTSQGLVLLDLVDGNDDHNSRSKELNAKLIKLRRLRKDNKRVEISGEGPNGLTQHVSLLRSEKQEFIGVYLMTSFLQLGMVGIDFEPDFSMFSLPSLLGILAEAENTSQFWRFLVFYKNERQRMGPFATPIDCFFLFRDFFESIEDGATRFSMVAVDPHWGTVERFKSLAKISEVLRTTGEALHPDFWRVLTNTDSIVRLGRKSGTDLRVYLNRKGGGFTRIRIVDEFALQAGRMFGFFEELVEDVIQWHEKKVGSVELPDIVIDRSEKPLGDAGFRVVRFPDGSLSVTFNVDELQQAFSDVADRSLEWKLLERLLLAAGIPDSYVSEVGEQLRDEILGKPRFLMSALTKEVAFPEGIAFVEAEDRHFKFARKELAIAAKTSGVQPGNFVGASAKERINAFRGEYYKVIQRELSRFDWFGLMQVLLQECGARSFEEWMDRKRTKQSLRHDVAYDRAKERSKRHETFIQDHKNLRLLIEILNDDRPDGSEKVGKEDVGKLIAMSDWFHVIQSASDMVHYGLEHAELNLSEDFVPSIAYPDKFTAAQNRFRDIESAERTLWLGQNGPDLLQGIEPFVNAFSDRMLKSLGFRFEIMLAVLDALSRWGFSEGRHESPIYLERKGVIAEELATTIKAERSEILSALNWLILDHTRMRYVEGADAPASMMPIWESKKRPYRYTIKPLIGLNDHIIWEPNSCDSAKDHWLNSIVHGQSPIEFPDNTITSKVAAIKSKVEENLEESVFRTFRGFSQYVEKNLDLAKRFKNCGLPKHLGDFDVLVLLEEKQLLVAVECKDLYSPYCVKDARRFRDKLYGREGRNESGYYDKAENRGVFLENSSEKVFELLGWPKPKAGLEVVNVFVVPRVSLWHFYSPREYFLEPHSLESLLVRLQLQDV